MNTHLLKLALLVTMSMALGLWLLAQPLSRRPQANAFRQAVPGRVSFERDIKPILATRCLACHGAKKQSGGLRLDAKAPALRAAIVPGKAAQSRLYQRVVAANDEERMPPVGERLSAAEIGLLKAWIDSGAQWPETAAEAARQPAASGEHWAWQPLTRPAPPTSGHPISKIRSGCGHCSSRGTGQRTGC